MPTVVIHSLAPIPDTSIPVRKGTIFSGFRKKITGNILNEKGRRGKEGGQSSVYTEGSPLWNCLGFLMF